MKRVYYEVYKNKNIYVTTFYSRQDALDWVSIQNDDCDYCIKSVIEPF